MIVDAQVSIRGTIDDAWRAITDVAHFGEILKGVEKVEVVEAPPSGWVGLKWRETRLYFGELATVEKRITAARDRESYETHAESDGFVFLSTMKLSASGDEVVLATAHETVPQGFVSRLKALPMVFFKGAIRKALLQDLEDFKAAVEKR